MENVASKDMLLSIIETIQSPEARSGFQQLIIHGLRGKPVDEAAGILKAMEEAGPTMATLVGTVAHSLRQMPIGDFVKLLGAPGVITRKEFVAGKLTRPKKRAMKVTAKRRAALKVQGRYMGLLRHFSGSKREYIKKLAAARGNEKAIKTMEGLLIKPLPKVKAARAARKR